MKATELILRWYFVFDINELIKTVFYVVSMIVQYPPMCHGRIGTHVLLKSCNQPFFFTLLNCGFLAKL